MKRPHSIQIKRYEHEIYPHLDFIDSAIFTGDIFDNGQCRAELRDMMARWERELQVFDRLEKEMDDGSIE